MKLILKIGAGLLVLFLLLVAGLNLYLTDERLREMVMPQLQSALDREVEVDRLSITFFRTFPRFGLQMEGFRLAEEVQGGGAQGSSESGTADEGGNSAQQESGPESSSAQQDSDGAVQASDRRDADQGPEQATFQSSNTPWVADGEPAISFERLTAAVRLFPLLRSEIAISRLELDSPRIWFRIYEDGTTNYDSLMAEEEVEPEETEAGYTLQIPKFAISNASIFYRDASSGMRADLEGLSADIGLAFADRIESTVDADLTSLSLWSEETEWVNGLSLELRQQSTIDTGNEILTLDEGTLSIRGLALNLQGSVSSWSSETPHIDLQFSSAADNFGELLRLAPPEYDEQLQGLETRGSLTLEGYVTGELTEGVIPDFRVVAEVADGFIQNPDLEEPIEAISLSLNATGERIDLNQFSATASGNTLEASGTLEAPFEEESPFTFRFSGDVDLATISRFYPLDEVGIESLTGQLATQGEGSGIMQTPEEVRFSGFLNLQNGALKYADVGRPIEQIEADIEGTQDLVTIRSLSLSAAGNRMSASGSVRNPMSELPEFDVRADADLDLASLPEFYPIDQDTLSLSGRFTAEAHLRGQADALLYALQESEFELRDGHIFHHSLGRPLEDVTLVATASSNRLILRQASLVTGENRLSLQGTVTDYLEDEPLFDLQIEGLATLAEISDWYSLEPWINEMTGQAEMNLHARGPAGDPTAIALNGALVLADVSARGDSLALPVTDLAGSLSVTPDELALEGFTMQYGSSDIALEGRLTHYQGFLQEEGDVPAITGSYHSRLLNMDEMIDWEEESDEPLLIHLPRMTSRVEARIDSLLIFGVPITEIVGESETNSEQITIRNATARLFNGSASGQLIWEVPQPDHTRLHFEGGLQELQAEAFFREFPMLGENSRFEQHVTGAFSADVTYQTEFNSLMEPLIETTQAEGEFGMSRARLQGHPVQERLADWLGANELRSLALDEWSAIFSINESVLTFSDFRLTSESIGIELNGTQHLETDEIDFTATLMLPAQFRRGLSSVLSSRVVDALSRDDGIIEVPVRITGTMGSPQLAPRQSVIENLLRDTGRDILRGLFNRQ